MRASRAARSTALVPRWLPAGGDTGHAYAQWVHADEPKPSPPGAMCAWNNTLYKEVGDNYPDIEYFTLDNVKERSLRAEKTWRGLANQARKVKADRERHESERLAARQLHAAPTCTDERDCMWMG